MNEFLPADYEIPKKPSMFTKFEKDKTTKIRILPSGMDKDVVICYEYFDTRGEKPKPIRSVKPFEETPGIKEGLYPKEVWNFKVWNYELGQVQLCSISQVSIKETIMNYYKEEDFGSPIGYDLKIGRSGESLETRYNVIATPPKDFDKKLLKGKDVDIDWFGFFESKADIFTPIKD